MKYIRTNHQTGKQTAHWTEDVGHGWTLEFTSHAGKTHGSIYREHYQGLRLVAGDTLDQIRDAAQTIVGSIADRAAIEWDAAQPDPRKPE